MKMSNKDSQIILEDNRNDFSFKKNKSNVNISFNRVSFIFFIIFVIFIIFSIHLVHLGSRVSKKVINENLTSTSNKLYRADIIDRNGKYLSCLLYTSPSPRDMRRSRMPSSA